MSDRQHPMLVAVELGHGRMEGAMAELFGETAHSPEQCQKPSPASPDYFGDKPPLAQIAKFATLLPLAILHPPAPRQSPKAYPNSKVTSSQTWHWWQSLQQQHGIEGNKARCLSSGQGSRARQVHLYQLYCPPPML